MNPRIGIGYDIHRLVKGRKLILGGVEIPFEKGLEGHSDADVLIHAVCDAILGALGEGDIGEHFPNTDARYRNISSLVLLEKVAQLVKARKFKVGNVDVALQAEAPEIKDYKPTMKTNIAKILTIKQMDINIKATTQEGLDSIGKGEGIAAFASVILIKE